jgi:hypothetical protein
MLYGRISVNAFLAPLNTPYSGRYGHFPDRPYRGGGRNRGMAETDKACAVTVGHRLGYGRDRSH